MGGAQKPARFCFALVRPGNEHLTDGWLAAALLPAWLLAFFFFPLFSPSLSSPTRRYGPSLLSSLSRQLLLFSLCFFQSRLQAAPSLRRSDVFLLAQLAKDDARGLIFRCQATELRCELSFKLPAEEDFF